VTEWCKKESCWERILEEADFDIPKAVQKELIPLGKGGTTPAAASGRPVSHENQERMKALLELSGDSWFALAHWAKQTDSLTSWDRKFAFSMGTQVNRGRSLSVKQLDHAERIQREARRLGFSEMEASQKASEE